MTSYNFLLRKSNIMCSSVLVFVRKWDQWLLLRSDCLQIKYVKQKSWPNKLNYAEQKS